VSRVTLRSARLLLREFEPGDAADVQALHRDARVREWLLDDYPLDEAALADEFIRRMRGFYRAHEGLGIWHTSRTDGPAPQAIGWFSLMPVPGAPGVADLGARLLPAAWGGSLSREGAEGLLAHAFDALGLARVRASCHPAQRSAQAVLGTLGFAALPGQAYAGQPAATFEIDATAFTTALRRPLRLRQREALRAARGGTVAPAGTEPIPIQTHLMENPA
jgi:RimJ/RimL family protein N-acetyltransferase